MDCPQDLYNLVFSSKFLMSLLTPETVIRSAVFNNLRKRDKNARKTMSSIMSHVTNRSIHIPSAHRMLRLLNAKVCERGDRCWGKNLNTGKAMPLNHNSTNRPFALALCDKCVRFGTTKVPYSHFSRFCKGVAFHNWNLLMNPSVDPKSGEANGPLLEVLELQQIENTYSTSDDKKSALEGIVQRALVNDGRMCPVHYEERAAAYHEMHENAEKEADDIVAAALEKDAQKYEERRQERIAKRMTRIRSIYDSLEDMLDGCPLRELALDCQWLEVSKRGETLRTRLGVLFDVYSYSCLSRFQPKGDERCIKFKCHMVEETLSTIISAPSSASDRSINHAANAIRMLFDTLHEKDFFSFSFIANSENRLRKGIYDYCLNETTPLQILESSLAGDSKFLQLLTEDKPVHALVRALQRMRGALPRSFALAVVADNDSDASEEEDEVNTPENFRRLAEVVWQKNAPNMFGTQVMTFTRVKETYFTCTEEFRVMKESALDYLAEENTRRFLQRDNAIGGRDDFTRRDALNQVFVPKTRAVWMQGTSNCAYDHLRNRNFESLRTMHEQYFRRPHHFSVNALPAPAGQIDAI